MESGFQANKCAGDLDDEKKYIKECIEMAFVSSVCKFVDCLPKSEHCETDGLENTICFVDRVVKIPSSVRL